MRERHRWNQPEIGDDPAHGTITITERPPVSKRTSARPGEQELEVSIHPLS